MEVKLGGVFANKQVKIIKVNKKSGDPVKKGESIFEIEAEKGTSNVNADVNGIIEEIKVTAGQTADSNMILARIKEVQMEAKEANEPKLQQAAGFNYFSTLMKPAKMEFECDIAIIGGGPGGYVAAIYAAKLGAKVILVEKESLGGTCLNWGCIPTKSFVRSAQVYKELLDAEKYGCFAENVSVDMAKVKNRKDGVVSQLVQGIQYLFSKNGIKLVKGKGEFLDNETIQVKDSVSETIIKAKNIIIATGSKPGSLKIPGIDLKNVINSTGALSLEKLPKKMVIIGGGVIGMEFAFIYSSFGVDVSVIEYFDRCLMNCDEDISKECENSAKGSGIKIYIGSKVEEIIKTEEGDCLVTFTKNGDKKYISTEKVLMAVGRIPYTEGLGIEKLHIDMNDNGKGIKVNSKMQTNISNVYAIGDVTNIIQLAHVASHQGITAVKNIMNIPCDMDYAAVPSAIFTEPEIATVGLSEDAAEKQNIDVLVSKFPFAANGKALTFGETRGFVKIITDKKTNMILGAGIIGVHATDLISELTLAIKKGLTSEDIIETIHPHPTTSEVIHEVAMAADKGAIHFAK